MCDSALICMDFVPVALTSSYPILYPHLSPEPYRFVNVRVTDGFVLSATDPINVGADPGFRVAQNNSTHEGAELERPKFRSFSHFFLDVGRFSSAGSGPSARPRKEAALFPPGPHSTTRRPKCQAKISYNVGEKVAKKILRKDLTNRNGSTTGTGKDRENKSKKSLDTGSETR